MKMKHASRRAAAARIAAVCAAFLLAAGLPAQEGRTEHGSLDFYAGDGFRLAWAVLKAGPGRSPDEDIIVLRITGIAAAGLASAAPAAEAYGVDPFGGDRKLLPAAPGPEGTIELRLPRSHFADFPRTEIALFAGPEARKTGGPALNVYFLGIPDTTPEFLDPEKMEAYLKERLGGK